MTKANFEIGPPVLEKIFEEFLSYEGGSESSVIGIITLLINMIGCCIIP